MREVIVAVHQFQYGNFLKVMADLTEESLFQPGAGHGHPPAWLLAHLAISAELGQKLLGGELPHPEWSVYGRGSSDKLDASSGLTLEILMPATKSSYDGLCQRFLQATPERILAPHGNPRFEGTPMKTVGDLATLLLTNHFSFHLAQLSSCRRERGFPPLF